MPQSAVGVHPVTVGPKQRTVHAEDTPNAGRELSAASRPAEEGTSVTAAASGERTRPKGPFPSHLFPSSPDPQKSNPGAARGAWLPVSQFSTTQLLLGGGIGFKLIGVCGLSLLSFTSLKEYYYYQALQSMSKLHYKTCIIL